MKKISVLFIGLLCTFALFGQTEKVKGDISVSDTADLTIINVFPDSFPNVSVVFKAETRKGEPVWNLTKEKMTVKENSQLCNVISLDQISKNKPINLGIVVDHSGSMQFDSSQLYDKDGNPLFSFDAALQPVFPNGYTAPIDNAKSAVKNFVSTFNTKKDYISVVGFSTIADNILPLTQDIGQINSLIDSMRATNSTALYDAMLESIDKIKGADGVKVLVVLTDGQDNASKSNWNDVVDKANAENIPIYIVGLGDVNTDTLSLISKSTNGKFYYTQSSNSLTKIYAEISKQVQAFYNLVYSSENFSSADSSRSIELSFDIDTINLVTTAKTAKFPAEVIEFAVKRDTERQYVVYGGLATAILIGIGTLLFTIKQKNRAKQPTIKKLYPNPTDGNINLDYESGSGQLNIVNLNGQVAKSIEINGSETQFDLTDLQTGNYVAFIQVDSQRSNTVKFIVQR